ncbi:MAG: hypothetical protein KC486_34555 [Myxococcales bacterium]|nr:hypothetical protein [Myxococcales bacterium]
MRAYSLASLLPVLPLSLLALGSIALGGCAGDDGGTASESASSGSTSTSGSSTSGSSTTDATTDATATTSSGGESSTSTTAATTTTGESTTSMSTSTTGFEVCHFGGTGESGGSMDPWLEVTHKGAMLSDGITLNLECGLQGLFMLELIPYFGGFELDDETVLFDVVVDVDGFNDNPDGHFYSIEGFHFYVGCDVFDGGVAYVIPIIPPDTIDDLLALDGAQGEVTVTMYPDGGGDPVTVMNTVKVGAVADDMWEFCGYMP